MSLVVGDPAAGDKIHTAAAGLGPVLRSIRIGKGLTAVCRDNRVASSRTPAHPAGSRTTDRTWPVNLTVRR